MIDYNEDFGQLDADRLISTLTMIPEAVLYYVDFVAVRLDDNIAWTGFHASPARGQLVGLTGKWYSSFELRALRAFLLLKFLLDPVKIRAAHSRGPVRGWTTPCTIHSHLGAFVLLC